ncbi:NAD(P)-dependent glycerol-3-phosphate dehydrogenase [Nakamurella antarctica]|uniref:Glycerol-3-phosphate dehydrogenase [NAD(P)+] n=1 Tax=Nakamurella antarctica TaxID=1902245 RepID=A0A3G8ZS04_9ACTN|nr:NAD(P)-dependent glycerol-3-phosphate dehydrogenase [Nakamurella antarctica]
MNRVAVLGSGSWGTTFAKVLADAGRDVRLWARRSEVVRDINTDQVNHDYLEGISLPATLTATSDVEVAVNGADAVVFAVPSQSLRENLGVWRDLLPTRVPIISLAKGVEIGTGLRMSEVIRTVGHIDPVRIVVVSGPNLAREIAQGQATATVVACIDHDQAIAVQQASANDYFRPYTITDVIGAEIAGAGKNIIALACGMAEGLGLASNTQASLITRGLDEITRLGVALGAQAATFAGLAGIGDLVATCSSPLSRNRTFGVRLAQGMGLEAAQAAGSGQVAEGVVSCRSLRALGATYGISMPITDAVFEVCYHQLPPAELVRSLMKRRHTPE